MVSSMSGDGRGQVKRATTCLLCRGEGVQSVDTPNGIRIRKCLACDGKGWVWLKPTKEIQHGKN